MSKYDLHATELVKDVLPENDLKELVNEFMIDAGINMGSDFTDATLERAIHIIENNFRFLPVCYVASAFKKGSLGNYGTGRLVPRTIYYWLNEMTLEYNRDQAKEKLRANENDTAIAYDLVNYPIGSAIAKKIDWYNKGLLKTEDWDKIPLKELAEREAKKLESYPEIFGIKTD